MKYFKVARAFARRRRIYKVKAARCLEYRAKLYAAESPLDPRVGAGADQVRLYEYEYEKFTHAAEAIDHMWWDYREAMSDD